MSFNLDPQLLTVMWSLVKLVLIVVFFGIAFGMLVGMITYGRPQAKKSSKSSGAFEDVLETGIELSHALIDRLLGKRRPTAEDWMDDRKLLSAMRGMKPKAFEDYMARVFSARGYEVEAVGGSGDEGIDLIMRKDGRTHLVQCKKFITSNATPRDVREFYGAMGAKHADGKGFFITTHIFTTEAERWAEGKQMELIDDSALLKLVRETGVLPEPSVTERMSNCPQCGGTMVVRTNKKNGEQFFGCSNFPKCRYTLQA